MKRNRTILKGYFKEGCIPKESDFADLIDSMLNQEEDNLEKLPSGPLSVAPFEETLISFKQIGQTDKLGWQIKQTTKPKPGLSISEGTDSRLFIENGTGNVGIGVMQPTAKLEIGGNLKIADANSELFFQDNGQIRSADDNHRILFRRSENTLELREYGKIVLSPGATEGKETAKVTVAASGNVGIGTNAPDGKLEVVGAVAINDGTGYAVKSGYMASGSLTIGSLGQNFGGGVNWSANTAGLMLETQKNTEIVVHDSNHRLASMMYYEGDDNNRLTIGRDMGWGATGLSLGNSDLYFTKTDHNHTGFGNTVGYAAIENAKDYGALMILGRSGTDKGRKVRLWDYLEVNGDVQITGNLGTHGFPPNPKTPDWGGGIHTWDIEAEGSIWSWHGYASGARDLAENYLCDSDLEAGDIVCLDPSNDRIVISNKPNDPLLLGVISTEPGFLLNAKRADEEINKFPVALCGRVPCKVVDENGSIKPGDLLTSSSTPGHAMKSSPIVIGGEELFRPGTVIGKALGSLKKGKGVVEIFVFSS